MDERILVHVPSIALGGVIRYSQRTIYRLLDRFKSFYRTSTTTIRPFLRQPFFTPPPLDSSPNPPIAILFLARLIFPRSATARRGAVSRIEERLEARRFFFLPHSSLPSPLLIGPVKLGNGFRGRAVPPMNIKSRLFGRNSHRARLSSGIISRFV